MTQLEQSLRIAPHVHIKRENLCSEKYTMEIKRQTKGGKKEE